MCQCTCTLAEQDFILGVHLEECNVDPSVWGCYKSTTPCGCPSPIPGCDTGTLVTVLKSAMTHIVQLFYKHTWVCFSSPNGSGGGALSLTMSSNQGNTNSVKSEPMSPSQSHLRPPSSSGMPGSPHSIHSHHSAASSPVPPDYDQSITKRPRMDTTSWNQV